MADENTDSSQATGGDPGKEKPAAQAKAGESGTAGTPPPAKTSEGNKAEKFFTQDQVNSLIAEEKRRLAEKAQAEKLEADGKYQELAEKRQAENERLQAEIKRRDIADLRTRVAAKHKLPSDYIEFLSAEDEAALEGQAEKLAKTINVPEAPNTDGGKGNNPPASSRPPVNNNTSAEAKPEYLFASKGDRPWRGA